MPSPSLRSLVFLAVLAPVVTAAEPVFEATKIWPVQITLDAKEYDAMQPPTGGGFRGFGAPPPPPKEVKPGEREVHQNVFGVDQPWAKGSITVGGQTFEGVGIRYKGNGTMMDAARTVKKSFKIDLDKHGGTATFHGLKTLHLHCGVTDPSKSRETLAYAAFRAAGVPAPKTTLAEVTLTVPGKFDKELLGVYTLAQPVDKAFLTEHFKTDKGLLFKPERLQGLDHLGDDWERYKTTYDPKRDATPDEQKRLIAFTKLVNRADEAFRKEVGDYLDVDNFLRFLAVNALIVNTDSFFVIGHNYYLHLHPDTKKFQFLPWDLDRSFANFPILGTPAQQLDLSLVKPYQASRLTDRLMAVPGMAERYQKVLKEVVAAAFTKEKLLKEVEAMKAATKDLLAREAKAMTVRKETAAPPFMGAPVPELPAFVEKRTASVTAQLEGKSKGYVPQAGGFGFAGPPGGGGGFGPGNQLARPLVDALDSSKDGKLSDAEFAAGMKKFFTEWDGDKNGTLDQKEIADGLQKLMPAPGGFGQPPVRR